MLTLSLAELIKAKSSEKDAPEQAANVPDAPAEQGLPEKARKRPIKRDITPDPINTPAKADKAVKTEIRGKLPAPEDVDKLPWEIEPEPVAPAAEELAKDNLLNDEIEL